MNRWGDILKNGVGFCNRSFVFFRMLADLLFPPVCTLCGRALVRGEKYLCTYCAFEISPGELALCYPRDVYINIDRPYRPEALYFLIEYNKSNYGKQMVYALKYGGRRDIGLYMGRILGLKMKGTCRADCIVAVPLHRKRERQRGYNQAYMIALGLAEALGLEVYDDVIVRTKNNASQTKMNTAKRKTNVEDIFRLNRAERIRGRHVLLVDDVITTGATVMACLKVLADAGEVTFSLACLAKTAGGKLHHGAE